MSTKSKRRARRRAHLSVPVLALDDDGYFIARYPSGHTCPVVVRNEVQYGHPYVFNRVER